MNPLIVVYDIIDESFMRMYFPAPSNENKQESNQEQGTDEMDMGDMDKLEQDGANIGEVKLLGIH